MSRLLNPIYVSLILFLFSSTALGYKIDEEGSIGFYSAMSSCGEYIKARDFFKDKTKTSDVEMLMLDARLKGEIHGYLTAYNVWRMNGKKSLIEGSSLDGLYLFIENYCRDNPLDGLASAFLDLKVEKKEPDLILGNELFVLSLDCQLHPLTPGIFSQNSIDSDDRVLTTDYRAFSDAKKLTERVMYRLENKLVRWQKKYCSGDETEEYCFTEIINDNIEFLSIRDEAGHLKNKRAALRLSMQNIIKSQFDLFKHEYYEFFEMLDKVGHDATNPEMKKYNSWICDFWLTDDRMFRWDD